MAYLKPGWFVKSVFNPIAMRFGIGGTETLTVKTRRSGREQRVPVIPVDVDGERYVVSTRGETEWVRNMRVAGGGRLLLGRRAEAFEAVEIPDEEKVPILRAYLKRWKAEVGVFFEGVGPDSGEEELQRIAPRHPVFRISTRAV